MHKRIVVDIWKNAAEFQLVANHSVIIIALLKALTRAYVSPEIYDSLLLVLKHMR